MRTSTSGRRNGSEGLEPPFYDRICPVIAHGLERLAAEFVQEGDPVQLLPLAEKEPDDGLIADNHVPPPAQQQIDQLAR